MEQDPEHIVKSIERQLQVHAIPDPKSRVLNVTASGTLGGMASLIQDIRAGLPPGAQGVSDVTIKRTIVCYLDEAELGLCVHHPGHNACTICLNDRVDVAAAATKLELAQHALEDAEAHLTVVYAANGNIGGGDGAGAGAGTGGGGGGAPGPPQASAVGLMTAAKASVAAARADLEKREAETKVTVEAGAEHLSAHYQIANDVLKIVALSQATFARSASPTTGSQ